MAELLFLPSPQQLRDELSGRRAVQAMTDGELDALLASTAQSLLVDLPDPLPVGLLEPARRYVLFATASQLEDRLNPEQARQSGSNAERLDQRAGAELSRLRRQATVDASGGSPAEPEYWSGSVPLRR